MTAQAGVTLVETQRSFVLALDRLLDFLVAHDVGGMQVVRIFNRRMRSYEQLPKHVQREIPTPWYLTPEQNTGRQPE